MSQTFSTIAQNASEAAYPHLWKGLVGAFVPRFGVTGERLIDLSPSKNSASLRYQTDLTVSWQPIRDGFSIFCNNNAHGVLAGIKNLNLQELSIVAVCRFLSQNSNYNTITNKEFEFTNRNWWLGTLPDGKLTFRRSIGAADVSFDSGVVMQQNTTYHIAATSSDELSHSIWIDGHNANSTNYVGTRSTAGTDNWIGVYRAGQLPLNGYISSLLYYDRALSAAEIKRLYSNPNGPFERKRRRVYSIPGPAFKAAWAARATTIAGVLR